MTSIFKQDKIGKNLFIKVSLLIIMLKNQQFRFCDFFETFTINLFQATTYHSHSLNN